jgi:hypothetical protein
VNIFRRARAWLSEKLKTRPQLRLFLQCLLIVTLLFADVIFKNASISMSDQANFTSTPRSITTLYRERDGLEPSQPFFDFGGSAYQSEPAIQFLKYCIYNFQSPYWNPYSGSGSFGPETMVDIKFSPISLLIALLGGSSLIFHLVMLLTYTFSIYFLARVLLEHFDFSLRTSLTSCIVFLLNGYFTANISSNTNQTYLYFPMALFAILSFCKRPQVNRYLLMIGAYVVPLAVTFFPTTVLMVTCACLLVAASTFQFYKSWKQRLIILALNASAPLIALLVLSFLYIPLFEALKFVGAFDLYSQRSFYPANFQAIISLFSGKHVFELHNAMHPSFGQLLGNEIFHFGIIPGCIVAILIFSSKWWKSFFVAALVALFTISVGRIFDAPLISAFVDKLPFFRNIAEQYWWMMVACPFPLLFAFGLDHIEKLKFKLWPAALIVTLILVDLVCILKTHDIVRPEALSAFASYQATIFHIVMVVVISFFAMGILGLIKRNTKRQIFLVGILCFSVFFEMNFYFYRARFTRMDAFNKPPDYIAFLKENLGLNRVAAYGSFGLPPEIGTAYQLQQIEFFTMNIFPSYYNLCQRDLTTEHGWWGKDTFCVNRDTTNKPNINLRTLNLLSVRYMLVAKPQTQFVEFFDKNNFPRAFESQSFIIYENPSVLPRTYGVKYLYKAPLTPDTQGQSAGAVAFTEDNELVTDATAKNVALKTPETLELTQFLGTAKITAYQNAYLKIEGDFPEPGILVLPDNWHPGWKATVNSEPVYIGKVNESFRGVALKRGKFTLEMRYHPWSLTLGLSVSAIACLGLLILFIFRRNVNSRFPQI